MIHLNCAPLCVRFGSDAYHMCIAVRRAVSRIFETGGCFYPISNISDINLNNFGVILEGNPFLFPS